MNIKTKMGGVRRLACFAAFFVLLGGCSLVRRGIYSFRPDIPQRWQISMAISPSGKQIILTTPYCSTQGMLLTVSSGEVREVGRPKMWTPVFTPDESGLVYSALPPMGYEESPKVLSDLYLLDLRTGAETRLTSTPLTEESFPAIPPTGEQLYFFVAIKGRHAFEWLFELRRMNLKTETQEPIKVEGLRWTFVHAPPTFGKDTLRMGFSGGHPGINPLTGRSNFINILDLGGTPRVRELDNGGSSQEVASLSPDGNHVIYKESDQWFLRDISNGSTEPLPLQGEKVNRAVFSPDGGLVYYMRHVEVMVPVRYESGRIGMGEESIPEVAAYDLMKKETRLIAGSDAFLKACEQKH